MARLGPPTSRAVIAAFWILGSVVLSIPLECLAQFPMTELHSLWPPGGRVGGTIDLTVAGANQDDVNQLLFSHPGIKAEVKRAPASEALAEPQPIPGQFVVTIGEDVPIGHYDAWVAGRFSVSNVRTFVVGAVEEWKDDGSNRSPATARPIALGTTVNGVADPNGVDYYQLRLSQGQRVLVECEAMSIDSRMNGQLVVKHESGRELVRCGARANRDPIVDFTAPAEGNYLLGISDSYFEGGNDYFYRLRVHTDPRIEFVLPPSGLPGSTATYQIFGRFLPAGKPSHISLDCVVLDIVDQSITLPSAAPVFEVARRLPPSAIPLDLVSYSLGSSRPVLLGLASDVVVSELEPNSSRSQAQPIDVPCEIVGQFFPERDDDWYLFEAKKGDVYRFDVISQRLGLDVDPFLLIERLITDDKGSETSVSIMEVDDPANRGSLIGGAFDDSSDDPSCRFVAPEDGRYRVLVRDQFGDARRDPRHVYRLRIHGERPDFRIHAVTEEIKVTGNTHVPFHALAMRRGSSNVFRVVAHRIDGFSDDVAITAIDLPAGVTCSTLVLGGEQSSGWLCLEVAEDARPWIGPIRVVATANVAGVQVERFARFGCITWGSANSQQVRPEFRMTERLMASVVDETAPAHLRAGEPKIYETSPGGTVELPIRLTRRDGFAEPIKVRAQNAPTEITLAEVDIAADKSEGLLTITVASGNAKPGLYTFFLRSDTKIKYARKPNEPTDLNIALVSTPIQLRVVAAPIP